MRIKEYFLSFFDDAEAVIRDQYEKELNELNQKVLTAKSEKDIYQRSLLFICTVYGKSRVFEDISRILNKANYSQHDFIVKNIEELVESIGRIGISTLISADCKARKTTPSLPDVYINIGHGMNSNLFNLRREDERSWKGNYDDPRSNGFKIKRIIDKEIQYVSIRLQRIISYID